MSAAESLPAASPEPSSESLAANLDRARERIARAATRAGRSAAEIQLVCVSKTMPAERVIEALHSGATAFGENYVQEARGKIPLVNAAAMGRAIEWHLIGHLQTNKAKYCPDLFSVVQSIDSLKLAEELAGEALKKSKPALRVLVEVNLSENPGRAGVAAQDALTLCEHVAQIAGLKLEGLMGVAPYGSDPEEARPHRIWRTRSCRK